MIESRLHCTSCSMCDQISESPYRTMYDWRTNQKINTCSKKCFVSYMDYLETIRVLKQRFLDRQVNVVKRRSISALDLAMEG
jgi:hypothetical protein